MTRILFVDDERHIVDTWRQAMIDAGYRVVSRSSADEALDDFDEMEGGFLKHFDLIIQDMMMPLPECTVAPGVIAGEHSVGAFLLRQLRAWNDRIPVVVFTQLPMDGRDGALESVWMAFRDRQRHLKRPFQDASGRDERLAILMSTFNTRIWRKNDYAEPREFVGAIRRIVAP